MAKSANSRLRGLVVAAVGIFVIAMLILFYVESHVFKEVPILETTHTLIAGEPITANDLTTVDVPESDAVHGINASYADEIIHHWSPSLPIPAGSILEATSISIRYPKGDMTVYLTPTNSPPNLSPGDTVDILVPSPTASNASNTLPADIPIATDIPIVAIPSAGSGGSSGIEVAVPPKDVSQLVASENAGHISIVFASPGEPRIPIPNYAKLVTPSAPVTQGS